ncbi:MAG: patatin-like phospholipase family protein [Hydrogenophaga sp.]
MSIRRTFGAVGVLVAPCSIPGVFLPTRLDGRELVDGGLTSPTPVVVAVAVARPMGADTVIAVDLGGGPSSKPRVGLCKIIHQSFAIMGRSLAELEGKDANVLIEPSLDQFDSSDFSVRKEMIEAGCLASQKALPTISRLIATR